jgi:hypothetical protein
MAGIHLCGCGNGGEVFVAARFKEKPNSITINGVLMYRDGESLGVANLQPGEYTVELAQGKVHKSYMIHIKTGSNYVGINDVSEPPVVDYD